MLLMIIDCGTTNLRVTLADRSGKIYAVAKRPGGVRNTAIDGNNGRLRSALSEAMNEALNKSEKTWCDIEGCYAYGMITSNMGLYEIPHLAAPVSNTDLFNGIQSAKFPEIAPVEIDFIPGVRNFTEAVDAVNFTDMDMMRGEEIEAMGLWTLENPNAECVFVLPGSHNKFVHMSSDGQILGCMTSISGELLDSLTYNTILADAVGREFASADDYDPSFAAMGALECKSRGIGRAAFAGRILNQLGKIPPEKIRSYLLGAVFAEDMQALNKFTCNNPEMPLYVCGKSPFRNAFCDIAEFFGCKNAIAVPDDVAEKVGVAGVLSVISIQKG